MSFWGGGGDSATTAPACARAFRQGPAFPAQCSSPALGQSNAPPDPALCTQEPSSASRSDASITPLPGGVTQARRD